LTALFYRANNCLCEKAQSSLSIPNLLYRSTACYEIVAKRISGLCVIASDCQSSGMKNPRIFFLKRWCHGLMLLKVILSLTTVGSITSARAQSRAMDPVIDDPLLPRVLLIGDSISIGYTANVREMLQGVANVHRPLTNCGPTTKGVKELEAWLGDRPWDVIHFNFGLHDLKYMSPDGGNLADPKAEGSHQQVSIDAYKANIEKMVARLKLTGAELIWRNTTPVPEGARGRVPGDSAKYNAAVLPVMASNGIPVDDMFAYASAKISEIQRKADVHFTAEGSRFLAENVTGVIKAALALRFPAQKLESLSVPDSKRPKKNPQR
jgi:hypothetical protein